MKNTLVFALGIALTATVVTSHAQTYQWRDSSGRLVVSDRPPPASARDAKTTGIPTPPSTTAPQSADSQKTTAEKDMEFRKRQQEAREKSDKEAKEAAQAAQNRENCERARTHLQALESGPPHDSPRWQGRRDFPGRCAAGRRNRAYQNTIAESCK